MPTHDDDFRPARWLRNHHVQSMLASTAWRRGRLLRESAPLLAAAREVLLDCGEGVRLQCFISRPAHSAAASSGADSRSSRPRRHAVLASIDCT